MVKYLLWSNSFSAPDKLEALEGCDLSLIAPRSNTDLMMGDIIIGEC